VVRLAVEIDRFYQFSQPNYYEVLARRHLIEQVQQHIRRTLPNHNTEVFGSERTGLALASSDIDIRLIPKGQPRNPALARKPPGQKDRMKALQRLRKLYWNNLSQQKAYLNPQLQYARYPLISLQDRQSGLDVQIVLSNDTSLSIQMMKDYMEQYPYLRQLYSVVTTIFAVRGLNDVYRGGFGSYTLFMMIVASIRHNPHPRNDAAGGLINFLKFYRDFDTTEKGLSIEPVWQFDKGDPAVMTLETKRKLTVGCPLDTIPAATSANNLHRMETPFRHTCSFSATPPTKPTISGAKP
jgi:non-canonical poly(A) RNA polymerase PAPD5/7